MMSSRLAAWCLLVLLTPFCCFPAAAAFVQPLGHYAESLIDRISGATSHSVGPYLSLQVAISSSGSNELTIQVNQLRKAVAGLLVRSPSHFHASMSTDNDILIPN